MQKIEDIKDINYSFHGYGADEILFYQIENGMINLDGVTNDMKKSRKEQIVKKYHPYTITASKDGSYRTWIKDDSRPERRKQIVRTKRENLIDYLAEYYSQAYSLDEFSKITMRSLYDEWIEYKSLHVERTTIERVHRDWKRYYSASTIVDMPIKQLTKLTIDEWIHGVIKAMELNHHQYANLSSILRQELDYAVDKGIIENNPFHAVRVDKRRVLKRESKKPDQTQVFTDSELEKLFEVAWDDFYNKKHPIHQLVPLAVMFMFHTGLRIGEVCGIRYEDIDGQSLTIRRMVRPDGEVVEHTKGTYGERTIPLIDSALSLIESAKQRQSEADVNTKGYIFSMRDTPVLYSSVHKAFYLYCEKIGIDSKSSHKARKTFVSTLIDANVNINTVRQLVGHVDERTTLNNYCYDRSTDEEKRLQIEKAFQHQSFLS